MKKLFTLIITISIIFSAQAEGLDTFFDKAIRKGRSNNGKGSYSAQFENKNISVDNVLQFMQKKGYILTDNYSTKRMLRFGTYVKAMGEVNFITKPELESFIANTPKTNTIGKAIIHSNSRKEIIDIYWSGSVQNGWISGNGIGYTKLNNSMYIIKGNFSDGIPHGKCEIVTATPSLVSIGSGARKLERTDKRTFNYSVGDLNNGYRSLYMNNKYGFIDSQGNIIASCKYGKIIQQFNRDGYAIVTDPSDGDQEIKINTSDKKLGYSDNQLRINEEKRLAKIAEDKRIAQENKRKEEERIRRERERALAEAHAEEIRKERIRNAKEGDRIYYEQEWTWDNGGWWIWHESGRYTMKVVCFVEKNVNNGERLQIRVGSVESTSDKHYSTPEINGIKFNKGDVTWIEPLWDRNWHM